MTLAAALLAVAAVVLEASVRWRWRRHVVGRLEDILTDLDAIREELRAHGAHE